MEKEGVKDRMQKERKNKIDWKEKDGWRRKKEGHVRKDNTRDKIPTEKNELRAVVYVLSKDE